MFGRHVWLPWLIVAGFQVPVALCWSILTHCRYKHGHAPRLNRIDTNGLTDQGRAPASRFKTLHANTTTRSSTNALVPDSIRYRLMADELKTFISAGAFRERDQPVWSNTEFPMEGLKMKIRFQIIFSMVLLIPNAFCGETGSSQSGGQAGASGGAYSRSVSPSGSADNLLFTGAFTYNFPIEVPPGISGMQPELSLDYNSMLQNGWVGVGWDLSLGSIQRSVRNGVPKYDDSDTFLITLKGQTSELVRL